MSTHELLQRLDRVEAGVVSLIAERDDLQARLVKAAALAGEWEAVALRLSPGSLTAGVRQNCAADLRAALAPTTKEGS